MAQHRRGKLVNVEAGRGIAATLVVLFHATKYYFGTPKYWPSQVFHQFFLFGHAGVEFFFVLSGFIMVWVHRQDIGRADRVKSFAWKRFQRIYPFFWVVLAVTLILIWTIPALGQSFYRDPAVILQSIALVGQNPLHAVVFVSWTLWHELIFYAFCAAVIALPRAGIPAFLLWTITCAALQFTGIEVPWPTYMTEFINILFAFGVGVGLLLQRSRLPAPGALFGLGVVLFVSTAVVVDYTTILPEWSTHLLFGLGGALALAGCVELERSGRLIAPRWMTVLGAASFSIYLTHILSLTLLGKIATRLHLSSMVPATPAFLGMTALAIGGGVAIHYFVERPVIKAAATIKGRFVHSP